MARGFILKWFKHDSNAHCDAKMKKLRHKYGITGYGLYWYCIELIAGRVEKENITFQLEEDAEIIALEWSLDQIKVQEIMAYMVNVGLFEESSGVITCFKLAQRLDDTQSKNPQIKQIQKSLKNQQVGETPNNSDQIRLDKTRLNNSLSRENQPFPMSFDWQPDIEQVKTRLRMMGKSVDLLSDELLGKFKNHYEPLNGQYQTQGQWEALLAKWVANEKTGGSHAGNKQGSGASNAGDALDNLGI